MKIGNQYIVHFGGLKEGYHDFEFIINKKFFEEFDAIGAEDGELDVTVRLHRKNGFLSFGVIIMGNIHIACDRCLEYFDLDINYEGNVFVKFSEKSVDDSPEDVFYLHPDDTCIDLKHYFYESVRLSIPLRKVHPETNGKSGCNNKMLDYLKNNKEEEVNATNPMWDELKKLMNKK